jgi:hypothetical protein
MNPLPMPLYIEHLVLHMAWIDLVEALDIMLKALPLSSLSFGVEFAIGVVISTNNA